MAATQGSIMLTTQMIPFDELKLQLRNELKAVVQECLKEKQNEQYLSPIEVCRLYASPISKTTLQKYTREGKFTAYSICGRVVYKCGEVITAIQGLKKYQRNVA